MDDPEAIFQEGWLLCDVGEHETGPRLLRRAVDKGYTVAATLARQPRPSTRCAATPPSRSCWPTPRPGREQALAAFREAGGERLLGR